MEAQSGGTTVRSWTSDVSPIASRMSMARGAPTSGPGNVVIGQHGQELEPGPHLGAVLLGHHARDLRQMPKVVRYPGREQLPQGDGAERGVLRPQIELCVG